MVNLKNKLNLRKFILCIVSLVICICNVLCIIYYYNIDYSSYYYLKYEDENIIEIFAQLGDEHNIIIAIYADGELSTYTESTYYVANGHTYSSSETSDENMTGTINSRYYEVALTLPVSDDDGSESDDDDSESDDDELETVVVVLKSRETIIALNIFACLSALTAGFALLNIYLLIKIDIKTKKEKRKKLSESDEQTS